MGSDRAFFKVSLVIVVTMISYEYRGRRVNRERVKDKTIICGLALLTKEPTSTSVYEHSIM